MNSKKGDYDSANILRSLEIGFLRADKDGFITTANEYIADMFGYSSPEEMIGLHMNNFYASANDRAYMINNLKSKGKLLNYEIKLRRKDGSSFWSLNNIKTFRDEHGNFLGTEGVVRDITNLREAEERLLNATGRMARVGGWELDPATSKVSWTEEIYRIHEVPVDHEPPVEEAINFFHPEDRPKLREALKNAIEKGVPYDLTLRFITAKGKHLIARTICRPQVEDGKIVRLSGTFQDVTDWKKAEQKLQAANQQLAASEQQLRATNQKLEAANQQLAASEQQLRATNQKLEAANQQLAASEQQLRAMNKQLKATNQQLAASDQQLRAANQQLQAANQQLAASEQQLRASEAELSRNLEKLVLGEQIAGLGYFERNWQTGKGFWSKGLYALLGLSPDEIDCNNDDYMKFIHPGDLQRTTNHIKSTLNDRKNMDVEFRLIQSGGNILHIHGIGKNYFDKDGKPLRSIGTFQDITERKNAEIELKESENNYRVLAENARHFIITHDLDGVITYANTFTLDFINVTKDRLIGKNISELLHSKEQKDAMKQRQKDFESGKKDVHHYQLNLKSPSGEDRILEVFGNPIKQNDKITSVLIVAYDITERMQAEIELEHSHELLKYIIEHTQSAIAVHDNDMNYVYVSQNYLDQYKVSDKDIIGKNHYEVFPDLPEKWRDVHKRVLKGEILGADDDPYEKEDGTVEWTKWHCRPWYNSKGEINGLIVYTSVITEEKKIRDAIKESEASLRDAQRIANIGDWSLDLRTGRVHMSDEMFNLIGIDKSEAADLSEHEKYYTPEKWQQFQEAVQEAQETGMPYEIEMEFSGRNAQFRYAIARGEPVFNEANKIIGLKGTLQDITKQKEYESQLIKVKEKAEESDRLKSAFLSNMSHEIRTPMNGILGFASLLNESDLTASEQKKYIDVIEKSGQRMLNIINDIIDISKIESGTVEVNMKKADIIKQLNYIHSFFKPEAEHKRLDLILKKPLPEKAANIITDSDKVSAILINLIKNAIKYTDKGYVKFGCDLIEDKNSAFLQFYVKDTGIGIAKNRQEAIFERFIQADIDDTHARQGAGLGLSISKAYTEMLGGKIWIESNEGEGSVFYFKIPCKPMIIDEHDIKKEPGNKENFNNLNLKILIADDDKASSDLISIFVNKCAREIISVLTGTEALEECRNNPDIDLIFMDIQMPGLNGYKATQQIREFNKEVVIIAQTAYGLSGDREKSLEAGCNDYIAKPVKKNEIMGLIQKYYP
ncbi:MAG: PAS domain S-box protein [Bacteroidales bacterium]|nr:PAS domain S-box protein [Bacteroidales bacterium]